MVRPKEYTREKVLDDATRLFWQKGFHGTSLSELVAVTGLNRHSMYKEFGSKAGLFEECLANYFRKVASEQLNILEREPLGLSNIRDFFRNRIEQTCSKGYTCCLIVKTALEKELIDGNALERIRLHNEIFQSAFKACICAGIEKGEVPETADPDPLTDYLIHYLSGMNVVGKPRHGKQEAERMLDLVMSAVSR